MPRPKYENGKKTAKERMSEAFWTLLQKRPYDQIAVLDITRVAGVNKNTFYYHYTDIDDMTREAVEDVLIPDALWHMLENMNMHATDAEQNVEAVDDAPQLAIDFDERFKKLCLLAGDHTTPWLRGMLKDAILQSWADRFSLDISSMDEDDRLFLEFALGGVLEVMAYSTNGKINLAFDRIAVIGSQMGLIDKLHHTSRS